MAANTPFRRTGLGKIRAYRQGEALAKLASAHLSNDDVGEQKLFMIVHELSASIEAAITAQTAKEALAHIEIMLELAGTSRKVSATSDGQA